MYMTLPSTGLPRIHFSFFVGGVATYELLLSIIIRNIVKKRKEYGREMIKERRVEGTKLAGGSVTKVILDSLSKL